MGDWYTIGLALGLGLGLGLLAAGILASSLARAGAAVLVGALVGLVAGFLVGDAEEIVAGSSGGALGALSGATVGLGAIRRGATRLGLSAYLGAAGVLACLLSLIPLVGYVLTVALPVLAVRARGRRAARYAGLRTLAK